MTPTQAEELLRALRDTSHTLQELHERASTLGSTWTLAQLRLFLLCANGVRYDSAAETFHLSDRGGDELQGAILDAVRSFAGKPVFAMQVRARLPNQFVITDEQIVAVARRTPGLEVFGPHLIRIAR